VSALTLSLFQRPEHGMGRSFALSALVHIVLAAVLFLGVRWQVSPPDVVEVELVAAPPPPPPAPVVEAPKPPPPRLEPEVVKPPPPPIAKPDIAVREKPKPKPKPEPKKVEKKPPPKDDPELKKRMQQELAAEQKALDQQRQERELKDLIARQQADAAKAAATARAKAMNEYIARLSATIRRNIPESAIEGIPGNPAALVDVVQIPTGEVISVRIRRSSGYPRYDEAVQRAVLKASPLPLPPSREMFERELQLTFRPQDK
jgi:colicin import membrane protein